MDFLELFLATISAILIMNAVSFIFLKIQKQKGKVLFLTGNELDQFDFIVAFTEETGRVLWSKEPIIQAEFRRVNPEMFKKPEQDTGIV